MILVSGMDVTPDILADIVSKRLDEAKDKIEEVENAGKQMIQQKRLL